MSEITSFGPCSCRASHVDRDADTEAQHSPEIDIGGVVAGGDANSDCSLLLYEILFTQEGQAKIHRGIITAVHLEQFSSGKFSPWSYLMLNR